MNTIRKLLLVTLLGLAGTATAQGVIVIDAVEMSPGNIILPGTANGMMTFRPCAGACEEPYERVQVTPETQFTVNGKRVKYEDFRREFAVIKAHPKGYALVRYETKTRTLRNLDIATG